MEAGSCIQIAPAHEAALLLQGRAQAAELLLWGQATPRSGQLLRQLSRDRLLAKGPSQNLDSLGSSGTRQQSDSTGGLSGEQVAPLGL